MLFIVVNTLHPVLGTVILTQLRESNQLAASLSCFKAAAVNAEPGWFDLQESVRRTIHWIDEAGKAGCKGRLFSRYFFSKGRLSW
jgi:hypothetical protein